MHRIPLVNPGLSRTVKHGYAEVTFEVDANKVSAQHMYSMLDAINNTLINVKRSGVWVEHSPDAVVALKALIDAFQEIGYGGR